MTVNIWEINKNRLLALQTLTGTEIETIVNTMVEKGLDGFSNGAFFRQPTGGPNGPIATRSDSSDVESLANRIRRHVMETSVTPARQRGEKFVVLTAGQVHGDLKLRNRLPAVCAALGSTKFKDLAKLRNFVPEGPANGSSTKFTLEL